MASRFILAEAPVKRRNKRVAIPNSKPASATQIANDMLDRYPTIMAHLAE